MSNHEPRPGDPANPSEFTQANTIRDFATSAAELQDAAQVAIATLANPPAREQFEGELAYLIAAAARENPANLDGKAEWDVKVLPDQGESIRYSPMNTSAQTSFIDNGYLGTSNIYGCVAAVAAYRDQRDTVHAWVGHYDANNVRETDETGKPRISGLLAGFAGQHPVKVAIAYPKSHSTLHALSNEPPDPSDPQPGGIPIGAIVEECKNLPSGSQVMLIPYETPHENLDGNPIENPIGHMLSVGRDGSDLIDFGWNGHPIQVGEPEVFNEMRQSNALTRATVEDDETETALQDHNYDQPY